MSFVLFPLRISHLHYQQMYKSPSLLPSLTSDHGILGWNTISWKRTEGTVTKLFTCYPIFTHPQRHASGCRSASLYTGPLQKLGKGNRVVIYNRKEQSALYELDTTGEKETLGFHLQCHLGLERITWQISNIQYMYRNRTAIWESKLGCQQTMTYNHVEHDQYGIIGDVTLYEGQQP